MTKSYPTFLLFFIAFQTFAGGIRGIVKTTKNEPLAYTAVAIKSTSMGTMANAEGQFELNLAAGKYTVLFQYLGFKTLTKEVEIGVGYVDLSIVLEEQALSISEIKVGSKTEDPALTVMRRAIAKARFHALQVDNYSAKVYAKNTIVFDKINFLIRKQLEKQGFKEGKAIVNESVSEIAFSQPNKYVERVISTRNNFDEKGINPNQFIMSSFYDPTIVNTVSPLSPKAFGYYKFEYMGSFQENGVEVNKIKVIPRSYSDGVFRGQIYIFEDTWAIHSLALETIVEGFSINIKQVYNPIQNVQMPTNQNFHVVGGMMGFGLTFDYVVSVNYNSLKVNPSFREPPTIIDEKFKKPDNTITKTDLRTKKIEEIAGQQKELSTKQMRQLMREYEKQNLEERKAKKEDVAVVENDSVVIDSMANKRSDAFWNEVRTVPLTAKEIKSYSDFDSLKTKKAMNIKSDANSLTIGIGGNDTDTTKTKKKKNGFNLMDLLSTKTYRLTNNKKERNPWTLRGQGPLNPDNVNYNLVEGIWLQSGLKLSKFIGPKIDSTKTMANMRSGADFFLQTIGRYDIGRKQLLGKVSTGLVFWNRFIKLNTGHFVAQYNADNPVGDGVNAFTTLWFEQNLMKIYEKKYAQIEFGTELARQNTLSIKPEQKKLYLSGSLEWAQRSQLNNLEGLKPFINSKNREYTANAPISIELPNTNFETNTALILDVALMWQPGKEKFRVKNGIKYSITNHDMNLKLHYSKGIPNVANSEVDYDLIDLTWRQSLETGIRSDLKYSVTAGTFLNNNKMYFNDYKHFMGNEFFVQTGDGLSVFRALPYYLYSTRERFLEAHLTSSWRKLALTQIPYIRLLGFKENLLFHYLNTPQTPHYAEVGYGFDGLIPGFPFFRVEAVGTFLNFKYQNTVFRIGTTWKFGD